jgi:D-beta-D-heptose 7-phosphate kinase / D-beta-D-heptose 1-phosphate adenosyltransferase
MAAGDLSALVDAFRGLRVVVLGEAMLDAYLEGDSHRLSVEAPVPVVAVDERRYLPGGAANTAANVRALGARVALVSAVGADREADLLREALAAHGVATDGLLTDPGRETQAKTRVVAAGQMLLRFDGGSTEPAAAEVEQRLVDGLAKAAADADAILVSDYGYGILTPRVIAALGELQAARRRVLVVDSKHLPAYRDAGVTAVKPNYRQALGLLGATGRDGPRAELMAGESERILELTGAEIAAVTLDREGALVLERGRPAYRTYARRSPDSKTMGAGDTFAAGLALALAAGANTPAAAELASAAAGVVVAKSGTALCSADELRAAVTGGTKYVTDRARLTAVLARHRDEGRRVVFTNGCFDILHRGHVTYLSRAKTLGEVLVVGVNSDRSVERLKGPGRPVNPLEDRAHVLAALSSVDLVVPFDEDTPVELIRAVRPDAFVKGGDYTKEMLPEAPVVEALGGAVHLLPYVDDRSTTGIIDRIRDAESLAAGNPS